MNQPSVIRSHHRVPRAICPTCARLIEQKARYQTAFRVGGCVFRNISNLFWRRGAPVELIENKHDLSRDYCVVQTAACCMVCWTRCLARVVTGERTKRKLEVSAEKISTFCRGGDFDFPLLVATALLNMQLKKYSVYVLKIFALWELRFDALSVIKKSFYSNDEKICDLRLLHDGSWVLKQLIEYKLKHFKYKILQQSYTFIKKLLFS